MIYRISESLKAKEITVVVDGRNISGKDTAKGTAYAKALRPMAQTMAYLLIRV